MINNFGIDRFIISHPEGNLLDRWTPVLYHMIDSWLCSLLSHSPVLAKFLLPVRNGRTKRDEAPIFLSS